MYFLYDYVAYELAKLHMEKRHEEAEIYRLLKAANSDAPRLRDRFLFSISEFLISLGFWIKDRFEPKQTSQYSNQQVCHSDVQCC
jgi:hypothetical protein